MDLGEQSNPETEGEGAQGEALVVDVRGMPEQVSLGLRAAAAAAAAAWYAGSCPLFSLSFAAAAADCSQPATF